MEYATITHVDNPLPAQVQIPGWPVVTNYELVMEAPSGSTRRFQPSSFHEGRSPEENPPVSFKDIKAANTVRMTPYFRFKRSDKRFLGKMEQPLRNRTWDAHGGPNDKQPCVGYRQASQEQSGSYVEVTDYDYEMLKGTPVYELIEPTDASNKVLSNVASDASSTLDLLTEFAEAKETLTYLRGLLRTAINPLTSFKDKAAQLRKSKKKPDEISKDIASLWLQYRYAIMPLVYSVQDALEVLAQKDHLFQKHSSTIVEVSNPPEIPDNIEPPYMYEIGTITKKFSCVTKARYAGSSLTFLSLLGLSPARTAWEVTKLSFVVDWFVNVGAFIEGVTFNMGDLSSERATCVSVRTSKNVQTFLVKRSNAIAEKKIFSGMCGHQIAMFPAVPSLEHRILLRHYEEESYERRLVSFGEIRPELAPFLNWKRWLDAFSLALKPTLQSLRRLH